jgi:hypothetical protein
MISFVSHFVSRELIMKLRLAAVLVFAVATTVAFAASDSNNFTLLSKGKVIGKATYSISKIKEGYRVNTRYQYRAMAAELTLDASQIAIDQGRAGSSGLIEAQYSAEYRISPDGDLLGGFITDATSQMITGFTPSKSRDNINVTLNQAGTSGQPSTIPMPQPSFTLMPNFDPAAIQILLTTAIAHPHADSKYLTIIPSANVRSGPTTAWLSFQPGTSDAAAGTLDGKPVTLKHYVIKYYSGDADIYTDDAGTLMEADINATSASYVRAKFVLTPPAK